MSYMIGHDELMRGTQYLQLAETSSVGDRVNTYWVVWSQRDTTYNYTLTLSWAPKPDVVNTWVVETISTGNHANHNITITG